MTRSYNAIANSYTPLSYWQLSDLSGTTALDSQNISNGVYKNGVQLNKEGAFDSSPSAVQLDGQNDYIEVAHTQAFELASGTVQLWFNTTRLDGHQGLFSKDAAGKGDGGHFGIWVTEGRLGVRSQNQSRSRSLYSDTGLIQTGQWHQVTVSWGSSGLQVYLDGQKVVQDNSWTTGWNSNREPIVLGADRQNSQAQTTNNLLHFFSGQLDEVALFERALTEAEVQQLFQASKIPKPPAVEPEPPIVGPEPELPEAEPPTTESPAVDPKPEPPIDEPESPANQSPTAQNDIYQIEAGQQLNIEASRGVLTNDSDPEGDTLVVAADIATQEGGVVVMQADGSFRYSTPIGFTGTDQFTYTADDGQGGTSTATVQIDVAPAAPEPEAPVEPPTNNYTPLSYWQLSDLSGTTALDSQNISNGVYKNGVQLNKEGAFDSSPSAVQLDGQNDYIEVAHTQAFELASGTVQLWFNTTRLDGHQGLFSKDAAGKGDGGHFGIWVTEGRLGVRSQNQSRSRSLYSDTGLIQTGQWHQVTVSWGSSGLQVYLDGQKVVQDNSWTTGWNSNREPIVLGADRQNSQAQTTNNLLHFFSGQLDEVALFERALTEAEVQQLFQASRIPASPLTNQVPVVDAGSDLSQSKFAWESISLSGTVTDDSSLVTTRWIQKSGPDFGVAIFDDVADRNTSVMFSQAGEYVLQLVADDGTYQVFDEITATVNRPTIRLMPLGDSITQGNKDRDSYRRGLWKQLTSEGYKVDFVGSQTQNYKIENRQIKLSPAPNPDFDLDHEGHSAWRTDEILNGNTRFEDGQSNITIWADRAKPDLVLLHLGTNDIANNESTDSTIAELGQIIDRLRNANPNVGILIAQIIPTANLQQRAKIKELNSKIPYLAAQKNRTGSPVKVVDQWTGFNPTIGQDTYDGLHPNARGEAKVVDRWLTAIEDLTYQGNERFGRGKVDFLTGEAGEDRFVLGGWGDPYYNDGDNSSQGLEDYAVIQNFQKDVDRIQLAGSAIDYLTAASSIGSLLGTSIYWDTNKSGVSGAELIGVVEGVNDLDLNSEYFVYV